MPIETVQTPLPPPIKKGILKRGPSDLKEQPILKKRRLRMKEAVSQLSCLFCIVGLKKKDGVKGSLEKEAGSSKPKASLKALMVLSEGSNHDDSILTPSHLDFYSNRGRPLEKKQQRGDSPTSTLELFNVSRYNNQMSRLYALPFDATTSNSSLNNDDSPLASSNEARGVPGKEAGTGALETSTQSLPIKMRERLIYAQATTTSSNAHRIIKHCKSTDGVDVPNEESKKLRRIPPSIGRVETFDDMSMMGLLHPEEIYQVNGLLWKQNPHSTNLGYYSGPAVHGKIPHGKGFVLFANSDTYQGFFHEGKMQGDRCVYTSHNGTIYIGSFYRNLRDGHGEIRVGSMVRYVGSYYHGVPHGYGEAFNVDGSLFHKGQFEMGTPAHVYCPYIHQGDEGSLASELIPVACDMSLASTVGPLISRYDQSRATIMDVSDDSDDDSCFSDLTDVPNSQLLALSSPTQTGAGATTTSLLAPMIDDDAELERSGSILSLDPNDKLTAESLRLHTSSMVDSRRYQSLGPSFSRYRGRGTLTANKMAPASLYGRRIDL